MIEIRDGRVWFFDEVEDSVYPILDFELLSGYVCPHCKSIIIAYCVGSMTKDLLARYQPRGHHYDVNSIPEGGFYIEQVNHGAGGYSRNCKYQQIGRGRDVYSCVLDILGLGSLHSTPNIKRFVEAIKRGEYAERGIIVVEDISGNDEPLVLFDTYQIIPAFYNNSDIDPFLAKKLEEFIALHSGNDFENKFAEVEKSKLGGKRVKLVKDQTVLF